MSFWILKQTKNNPMTANTLISCFDGVDQFSTVKAEGLEGGGHSSSGGGCDVRGATGAREVIGCFNTTDKSAGIKIKVADHSS